MSRRSEPWALRFMGYASIVLAVVGLAAVGMGLWMRERPNRAQAAGPPAPSRSLPVVGAAPTRTRAAAASPTAYEPPTRTQIVLTAAVSATPTAMPEALPTATREPLPTATLTREPSPSPTWTATITPSPSPLPPTATPTQAVGFVAAVLAAVPGSQAAVQGTVVEISRFTSGVRCALEDGSGRLTIWLSQNVWAHIAGHEAWGVGCVIRAAGALQLYKDEIELVPQQAADVLLIGPAPAAQAVRVGDLSSGDVGRQVAVQGTIVEVWPFSEGIKYLFDDGSGRIVVLLWQGVYNDVPGKEQLVAGAVIRVSGIVQEYNGKLEIIPGLGHEISLE